jgi:hypothetical protein
MLITTTEVKKETFDNFDELGVTLEPISNAFSFIRKFYTLSEEHRKTRNPFSIQYEKMVDYFGLPSFNDEKNYWWFLDFKEDGYAIVTNEITGSQIYKASLVSEENSEDFFESIENFSDSMEEFWTVLFTMFDLPKKM